MHLNVLSFRLTRVGGKLVSVASCALTGRTFVARAGVLALALGLSSGANALNVLIVNTGAYAGTDTALAARQAAAGNSTTILGTGALGGSLSGYDQVWDMGYSAGLGNSYQLTLSSYLQGGGTLFLMGENPGAAPVRNPAITSFLTSLGAGSVSISGYGTASAQTIAPQFLVNNNTATVTFAGSGKFGSVGSGTCITSDCTAAAWGAGTLGNATAGTVISVLDINFLTAGYLAPAFTDNLIAYLAQQQQVGAGGGGAPASDIDTGSASGYDASTLGTQTNPAFKGGTLNIDSPSMTVTQNFSVSGAGGTVQANGTAATLSGVISDETPGTAGAMTITGSGGTVTLTGFNTYTGATTVAAGSTLALAGSGSIAASSGVAANGSLDISGTTGGASITTLSGAGTVALGSRTLTLANAGGTFAGAIGGSGGLAVAAGSETLTGINAYTGATIIGSGATLALAGAGSIATSSGVLADGALDVSAANGGSASITSLAGNGSVALGTTSLVLTGANGSFAGSIAGSGSVAVNGGAQGFSGTHAYTGATQIGSGATLALAGGGSIAASSGVANDGTLDISGTTAGATVATLTGAGHVALGSRTLTIGNAGTGFIGAFTGTGGVTVNGGHLNLTGTQAYSGLTTVGSGALVSLNGLSAGAVSVLGGGTLRGAGAIAGPVTVAAGGRLSPGNSPGVLTVASTVSLTAGATFEVEIHGAAPGNGAGFHDQLNVVGAGQQFNANGATLEVNFTTISGLGAYTPYVPTLGQSFRIVTADGGLGSTRFASFTQPDGLAAGTRLRVAYDLLGNSIDLRVVPSSFSAYSAGRALTRNAVSTATALDLMLEADDAGTATAAQAQLVDTMTSLDAAQFDAAVVGLAGEIHGALAAAQPLAGQGLQNTVARHLALSGSTPQDKPSAWVDVASGDARWAADGVSSSARSSRNELTFGVDLFQNASSRVGLAAATSTTQVASAGGGTGKLEDRLGVVYGQHTVGGLTADAQLGYGSGHARSHRADALAAHDPSVYSMGALSTDLKTRQAFAGAGVRMPVQLAGVALEPFVRLGTQRVKRAAGAEAGSSPSALSVGELSVRGTRVSTGLALASAQTDPTVARATYRGTLAVGHDSGALLRPVVSATLAGVATTIEAPQVGRSFVQARLFGTWRLGTGAYAYAGLSGEARSQRVEKSATLGLSVTF